MILVVPLRCIYRWTFGIALQVGRAQFFGELCIWQESKKKGGGHPQQLSSKHQKSMLMALLLGSLFLGTMRVDAAQRGSDVQLLFETTCRPHPCLGQYYPTLRYRKGLA